MTAIKLPFGKYSVSDNRDKGQLYDLKTTALFLFVQLRRHRYNLEVNMCGSKIATMV